MALAVQFLMNKESWHAVFSFGVMKLMNLNVYCLSLRCLMTSLHLHKTMKSIQSYVFIPYNEKFSMTCII